MGSIVAFDVNTCRRDFSPKQKQSTESGIIIENELRTSLSWNQAYNISTFHMNSLPTHKTNIRLGFELEPRLLHIYIRKTLKWERNSLHFHSTWQRKDRFQRSRRIGGLAILFFFCNKVRIDAVASGWSLANAKKRTDTHGHGAGGGSFCWKPWIHDLAKGQYRFSLS